MRAWLLQQAAEPVALDGASPELQLPAAVVLQQGTPAPENGPPETPFGMAGAPTPAWLPQHTAQSVAPEAAQDGAAPTALQRALQRSLTPGLSGAASPNVSRQACGRTSVCHAAGANASDASTSTLPLWCTCLASVVATQDKVHLLLVCACLASLSLDILKSQEPPYPDSAGGILRQYSYCSAC